MDEFSNECAFNDHNGESWYGAVSKKKFPHLAVGDFVRVRSVVKDTNSSNSDVIFFLNHSNILKFYKGTADNKVGSKISNAYTAKSASVESKIKAAH